MSMPSGSPQEQLGRQRDPEPPEQVSAPPPSLLLYVALLVVAAALLFMAHVAGGLDRPGLCVNLASDIIGAILILIVVEHRLRRRELRAIQHVPQTASLYVTMACSARVREIVGYARVLAAQLNAVAKPYYIPRPTLEATVAGEMARGVILVGGPRTGKSTMLHRLVRSEADEAMRRPQTARVPVLVSSRAWNHGGASDVLFETMRSYYAVSPKTFGHLLRKGRLLCVFDSVDEALRPAERLAAIGEFRRQHPGNVVLVSTRPSPDGALEGLGLSMVHVPPLTADETARLVDLRTRAGEHAPRGKGDSACESL